MRGNYQGSTIAAERERSVRILRRHAREIRARGVEHLALFGSIARDEGTEASDIDVLIDVPVDRKFSLIDLADLRAMLRDLLGRETDVLIRQDLRSGFRAATAPDAIDVF